METWGALPRAMEQADIERVKAAFAAGARRAQKAGFDMVELHGGTGYLLPQFLSRRTNLRDDAYGGDPKRRMRFPLEVVEAVREAVGRDFPVGYRFTADEYVSGGLTLEDTIPFARELAGHHPAYLSVMTGCYDSFQASPYKEDELKEAFMASFAHAIKRAVPGIPVIALQRFLLPNSDGDNVG